MKAQKTDVYGIIATVTEVVSEQTSKIEYIDEMEQSGRNN